MKLYVRLTKDDKANILRLIYSVNVSCSVLANRLGYFPVYLSQVLNGIKLISYDEYRRIYSVVNDIISELK